MLKKILLPDGVDQLRGAERSDSCLINLTMIEVDGGQGLLYQDAIENSCRP